MRAKVVPSIVRTLAGLRPVLQTIAHPPGTHPPGCPLVKDCTALELKTDAGSRWYGVTSARISSRLEMEVSGFNPRFEEMAAWKDAPAE